MTTSNHDRTTKLFLTPTLMTWWTLNRSVDPDRLALAQRQFDFYAEELKDANPYSSENDGASVERARRYLKQYAGTERVYAFMLGEADKAGKTINFNRDFPGSAVVLINNRDVRGAFTAGGRKFMTDAIAHADRYYNGETWVLGEAGPASISDRAQLERDLKGKYDSDWVKEWTAYLKGATVKTYGGLKDAANKLKQHSSNQAPLLEMSLQASQNTSGEDPNSKIFQPVQVVTPPASDKFVGGSNKNYIDALAQLQLTVDTLAEKPNPAEGELSAGYQQAKSAENTVNQIARDFDPNSAVQKTVTDLLMAPIIYVEPYLKPPPPGAGLNTAGAALCRQMGPVLGKYPFNPRGSDASLAEVDSLFRPKDGTLWQWVDANLAKFVTRTGFQFVEIPGSPVKLSPLFLGWLNRAGRFTEVAYKDGSEPKIPYTVKSLPSPDIDYVKWIVDGQTAQFPGDNPQAKPFVWPGASGDSHVVQLILKFKGGAEIGVNRQEGLWAVSRLVEQADRRPTPDVIEESVGVGSPKQVSTDIASGHPIRVSVEIAADPPIFRVGYFTTLTCVATVAQK
jgi:type VI secretion system protein ImpL